MFNSGSFAVWCFANAVDVHAQKPLLERRRILHDAVTPTPGRCQFVEGFDITVIPDTDTFSIHPLQSNIASSNDTFSSKAVRSSDMSAVLTAAMTDAARGDCEGLMFKTLYGPGSTYVPGSRTRAWLKLKNDYVGMPGGDTMDVVPIGGLVVCPLSRESHRSVHVLIQVFYAI